MATIRLKHVECWKDRYGKTRYYFRKGKGKRFALQGLPGSDAFNASYASASGKASSAAYSQDGTFNAVAKAYYSSVKFKRQKPRTQKVNQAIIERFCQEHGHRLVRQMKRVDVEVIISSKSETPAAANILLKRLRMLIKFAISLGFATNDPTAGVEMFADGSYHSWTESEIAKFEKRWPLGCRERVAFDLHLYTGQRRGDICALEPRQMFTRLVEIDGQPVEKHFIELTQEKTGKHLIIPLHTNLVGSLSVWRGIGETIIAQNNGKHYTVESYGNLMADAISKAKLPKRCVLHGLRKASARRLAEAGCSAHQIKAITGHETLDEVERYTRAANQELLAAQAIDSLGRFRKA